MWKVRRGDEPQQSSEIETAFVPDEEEQERILFGEKDQQREAMLDLKVSIHKALLDRLNLGMLDKTPVDQIKSQIAAIMPELVADFDKPLNRQEREDLIQEVVDELLGLGPLEPLLQDDTITDILVNGHDTVFVEKRGQLERVSTRFQDEKHLMRVIQKIVSAVGRRVDESSPFVDARLADGSRVNAIVAPLAIDGSLLSIRKFAKSPISIQKMIGLG